MRRLAALFAFTAVTTLLLSAASPAVADAQSLGERLKRKAEEAAKRKAEERTEKRAGEAADKALDKVECAASDRACQEKAASQSGATVTASGGSVGGAGNKVGEGAWANYDFKPGDRPLFVDDFTRDEVGDFPRRLELRAGNMEIVEWQGRRLLRGTSNPSSFEIPLSAALPERFTIEFDIKLGLKSNENSIYFGPKDQTSIQHASLLGWWDSPTSGSVTAGLLDYRGRKHTMQLEGVHEMMPVRVMVDGRYAKMYIGSTRVANVPNADLGRAQAVHFELRCSADDPCFVGNIRLMAGGKKLYDALAESGRVSTQGIYFDTGSDRIRPESTPTLKEIGQMLKENPDLKITIEGHTDNSGDAKANEELSNRRAAAVKAYLVEKHAIDASRLGSAGIGAKKPVAKNDSPEGRQQNRRVELVKM